MLLIARTASIWDLTPAVQEQKTGSEIFALDLSALYKKTTPVVFFAVWIASHGADLAPKKTLNTLTSPRG